MRVVSKFMTADVRIVRVTYEDGQIVVEGMVKEFMPMTVKMGPSDVAEMAMAVSRPLRERLASRLPARLKSALVPEAAADEKRPEPLS